MAARDEQAPGAMSPDYRRMELQTPAGPARYWGPVDSEGQPHGRGAMHWGEVGAARASWHCGMYRKGEMHGEGVFRTPDGDTFTGEFSEGKPVAAGRLQERIGGGEATVDYTVAYDGLKSFHQGASPMTKDRTGRKKVEDRLMRVAGMLSGPREGNVKDFNYDHCASVSGPLVWARPPFADCPLFNEKECRGKIVLVARGAVEFCRKYTIVKEAGAAGMIVVGDDATKEKYEAPCPCVHLGPFAAPDLPARMREVTGVEIPSVYCLKRFETNLHEGAMAFIHFDAVSPPGWKGGAIFVQDGGAPGGGDAGRTKTNGGKPLRNSEGEALAQWEDSDLVFEREGGAQLLNKAAPPKVLMCQATAVENRTPRECSVKIPLLFRQEVTHYGFKFSFGEANWVIMKRFSAFDRLDNQLNATFGLPPAGLPPKKLFGLDNPEVIQSRHSVLSVYLKDCISRPVLVLSPELQEFIEMPTEVRARVKTGGV